MISTVIEQLWTRTMGEGFSRDIHTDICGSSDSQSNTDSSLSTPQYHIV